GRRGHAVMAVAKPLKAGETIALVCGFRDGMVFTPRGSGDFVAFCAVHALEALHAVAALATALILGEVRLDRRAIPIPSVLIQARHRVDVGISLLGWNIVWAAEVFHRGGDVVLHVVPGKSLCG